MRAENSEMVGGIFLEPLDEFIDTPPFWKYSRSLT